MQYHGRSMVHYGTVVQTFTSTLQYHTMVITWYIYGNTTFYGWNDIWVVFTWCYTCVWM